MLGVAAVEQVRGDQGGDHNAGRPAQARSERVVVGKIDADGESADGSKYEHDQNAARRSMPGEEELELELPARAAVAVRRLGRGVRGDAFAAAEPVASLARPR